jgi:hypothetical protein
VSFYCQYRIHHLDSTKLRPRRATRGVRWIWFCNVQGAAGVTQRSAGSPNPQLSSFSTPALWASAGGLGGGKERVETGKMDLSEIVMFLAFEVCVLCVLAWRRDYRT